jgi:hypothetical protein
MIRMPRKRRIIMTMIGMVVVSAALVVYFLYSFMYGIFLGSHIAPYVLIYGISAVITVGICWYISEIRRANDI